MTHRDRDLKLDIDRRLQLPIYLQICERFKLAIRAGHLRPGDRVPAVRGLATELNTARGTIETAYRILIDEGYLQVRGAAGTYVSPSLPQAALRCAARASRASAAAPKDKPAAADPGRPPGERGSEPLPLQPGLPALDAFPRKVWSRLVAYRLRRAETASLAYPDPRGYLLLREKIATYLGLSRGVACTPDQVFVTGGYRATLELVLRALAAPGERMWFEDPGYLLARRFLVDAGMELVPVPVDAEGLMVERGAALAPEARFAVVTPSHQSPLGVTLSLSRRMALLDWASRAGSWVIEDDYDSEFRYAGRPLPALKSLDRHDRVIYCGTFSKVMVPGLRLAYVVVPERATARLLRICQTMNAASPYLLQAGVADFIAQGHFARHLKRMRALYAERRGLMVEALRDAFGARLRIDVPPGGMHLAIGFEGAAAIDDLDFAARARAAGLGVSALSEWYANSRAKQTRRGAVLGFANVIDREAAQRYARALRQVYDA
ncbi:PLP-dependent aminotransferase family protein [Burkholderia glumae]|uniref:MocR-like pyridoxine biosynthesis transcription factor PdxR n=1 Tax=Burkholderia glumae TaxID=337 RepID=UPI000C278FE0|nr:PLP-dependent aminotransferase family protein [Burkholderia glumae]PJO22527.1 DNA-binding protein [Burkholderia glumae AU6208]QHE13713.1 aminotransferase class I/II-fold pyridoxal phosphate-dependent enzyme [Burkholderia glumae AU6208]